MLVRRKERAGCQTRHLLRGGSPSRGPRPRPGFPLVLALAPGVRPMQTLERGPSHVAAGGPLPSVDSRSVYLHGGWAAGVGSRPFQLRLCGPPSFPLPAPQRVSYRVRGRCEWENRQDLGEPGARGFGPRCQASPGGQGEAPCLGTDPRRNRQAASRLLLLTPGRVSTARGSRGAGDSAVRFPLTPEARQSGRAVLAVRETEAEPERARGPLGGSRPGQATPHL